MQENLEATDSQDLSDPAILNTSDLMERVKRDLERIPVRDPEEVRREKAAKAQRDRDAEWNRVKGQFGKRFSGCSIENFVVKSELQRRAVDALSEFSGRMIEESRIGYGIFLIGPTGRGKDHLLVGMLQRAVRIHGLTFLWKNGLDLFGDFRDMMKGDRKEKSLIAEYAAPDILALSDPIPPAGSLTEYQAMMLQRVVDARYRDLKAIWVTCNASSQKEAAGKIGVPVVDRLCDNALVVKCDWENHRHVGEVIQ